MNMDINANIHQEVNQVATDLERLADILDICRNNWDGTESFIEHCRTTAPRLVSLVEEMARAVGVADEEYEPCYDDYLSRFDDVALVVTRSTRTNESGETVVAIASYATWSMVVTIDPDTDIATIRANGDEISVTKCVELNGLAQVIDEEVSEYLWSKPTNC